MVRNQEFLHILLVEDEAAHAQLIRRAFASGLSSVQLTVVSSLKAAHDYIVASTPDLIIADLNLPDGSGHDLLPADQAEPQYPVIVMTSFGDEHVAVEAMKAGAFDYVVKSESSLVNLPRIAERTWQAWQNLVERRWAEAEIRRRNRELTLLNQVIATSASNLSLDEMIRAVCQEVSLAFDGHRVTVAILDDLNRRLASVIEYVREPRSAGSDSDRLSDRDSMMQYLVPQKQPFTLTLQNGTGPAEIKELIARRGSHALLAVPLISGETVVIGSLVLETSTPRRFSTEDVDLVQSVAKQVAGAVVRDRLEKERQRLAEQFHQSQKMDAVGQLAAGIAHDFNNLLVVINGCAEMIQDETPPGDMVHGLSTKILRAGERTADLVRQLLAFARKQLTEPQAIDLNELIADTSQLLTRLIQEDIVLEIKPAEDLWTIQADPSQIEQIIVNLVVNARDAMPNGGHLTIETRNLVLDQSYTDQHLEMQPGEYVLLAISDTGCGMSEQIKVRIFEPFFTTKEVGKGTGLGLATVYGIVKQSKGNIWVYSEEQRGTIFKLYFPRIELPSVQFKSQASLRSETPSGTETVLLVEDDTQVRTLVRGALQKWGYHLLEAPNGDEALRLAQDHADYIHLLLTDVIMPGMNGFSLATRLTQLHPELKVLFMSGYTESTLIKYNGVTHNANLLNKPFSSTELAHKVRAVLDS
ncbi:MAG TPA: response regulator [Anaerolineae bacterium]|nr:response regulator [Anaerolineae bacterium]